MEAGNGKRASTVDESRRGAGAAVISVDDDESELESVMAMMDEYCRLEIRNYIKQKIKSQHPNGKLKRVIK